MGTLGGFQRRYGNGRRVFYGSLWTLYTFLLICAVVGGLSSGSVGLALVAVVLACLTGMYAYRIWTWQARRLWLLILF
jgi:hypothetical protein